MTVCTTENLGSPFLQSLHMKIYSPYGWFSGIGTVREDSERNFILCTWFERDGRSKLCSQLPTPVTKPTDCDRDQILVELSAAERYVAKIKLRRLHADGDPTTLI